ncbi:hypothetical protein LDENG_00199270 [Lucifuga dentata]|nr:hypothetical protein LDENG_00199270 [Lucifuga dentata]
MENKSFGANMELSLDTFVIPTGGKYPIFFLGITIYLFGIFCNLSLLSLIILQKNLHKPVYFILLSLPLNDLMGITAMLPKVLSDIVTETNKVYYPLCVFQGFLLHMYGGGILFILAAMSFDRYIAICMPLCYSSLMTPRAVVLIVSLVWGLDFVLIVLLFSLQTRLPRCRSVIMNVFCDNPSLLKLTCGNSSINNIIGLFNTAVMQLVSVSVQAFSYVKILITCVVMRKSEAKMKAIQTCGTHLVIFLILQINTACVLIAHLIPNASSYMRKALAVSILIFPPFLDPIIYGLKTKELKENIIMRKRVKMDGLSNASSVLTLQGFNLTSESVFPVFLFASLCYMIIVFCNLILIFTIVLNKCLHQPMYLILLNLPVNDLIGSTALFPQLTKEILMNTQTMQYSACVAQAFFIHIYAGGAVFILTAMAYDRYIAICCPLKYNTIMTNAHIMKIITMMWLINLFIISMLFFLLLRLPRCKSLMTHTYCDNPSLLMLVCANTTINNIYGLFLVALSQVIANGTIMYTYLQILVACFRSKRADMRAKAMQTCATHLIAFLLLECLGLFTIISYRIQNISPHLRRFIGVSTLIFPPTLNPIIYGLKTKEIREKVIYFFRNKILPF